MAKKKVVEELKKEEVQLSTLPCSHENCGGSLQLVRSVDQGVHVEDYYMCGKCKRGQTFMLQRKLRQKPRR